MRLDRALASLPEIGTRSQAEHVLKADLVLLSGKPVKSSHKIRPTDEFEVQVQEKSSLHIEPLDLKLEILFEDQYLIVINKPPGLVVHPGAGHAQDTLVNALVFHSEHLSRGSDALRPGIVHRLDKETSGVLVVAKNDRTHEALSAQFRNRSVHRIYNALAIGKQLPSSFHVASYIARHESNRQKFSSVKGEWTTDNPPGFGKWASTRGKVLQSINPQIHYLELKLETGRTHQIRVHLSELDAPIAGDELYGGIKKLPLIANTKYRAILKSVPRFALHASELGFVHPETKDNLEFSVSWPDDLKPVLRELGVREEYLE
jgi:23S rRNA pseudouridine1911/1915/1917 synthase